MSALSIGQVTGSNFSYRFFPLTRFLDDVELLGLRDLELWGIHPQFDLQSPPSADIRQLRRELDHRGLRVRCFTPEQLMYPVNVASTDSDVRQRSLQYFRNAVDIAAELGSEKFFLTSGRGWEGEPTEEAWHRASESLRSIVDYAAGRGIRCVLEALQRFESNLVTSVPTLERMLAAVGHSNLGIALDTVAMATAGESVADYTRAFGDRLEHVHLIDGSPSGHRAWGDGNLPLVTYLRELQDANYDGFMTFELFGYGLDPRPPVEKSLAAVRDALAQLAN